MGVDAAKNKSTLLDNVLFSPTPIAGGTPPQPFVQRAPVTNTRTRVNAILDQLRKGGGAGLPGLPQTKAQPTPVAPLPSAVNSVALRPLPAQAPAPGAPQNSPPVPAATTLVPGLNQAPAAPVLTTPVLQGTAARVAGVAAATTVVPNAGPIVAAPPSPTTVAAANDDGVTPPNPMRATNPQASPVLGIERFHQIAGNVNLATLANNDQELRALAGDTGLATLTARGPAAASLLSQASVKALNLDAATYRDFRKKGVSVLTDDQRATLKNVIADQRMSELRTLADKNGIISSDSADDLFHWIDKFDDDKNPATMRLARPDQPAQAAPGQPQTAPTATLTAAGRVTQLLLQHGEQPTVFKEVDFIKGFRNGTFDPDKLRSDTAAREILNKAGILGSLDEAARVNPGQPIMLTTPQLRALYRAVDRFDTDASADTFIARYTPAKPDGEPLPFEVGSNGNEEHPTDSGRIVSALNSIFNSKAKLGPGDPALSHFDVPLPSPTDTGDPFADNHQRLAERTAIDHDTFLDYARDARIDLDKLSPTDRQTLVDAGIIDANTHTIGGPNSQMSTLFARIRKLQKGRGSILALYDKTGFSQTPAGQALTILDRAMTRYDIKTAGSLQSDLQGTTIDPKKIDEPMPAPPQQQAPGANAPQPTLREQIAAINAEGGPQFDLDAFNRETTRLTSDRARAAALFNRLRAMGSYAEMRPGTFALSASSYDQNSQLASQETRAGRVFKALLDSGYVAVNEQQPRDYPNADGALKVQPGTVRQVSVPFEWSFMRQSDDCLRRSSDVARSLGGRAPADSDSGLAHYMATTANRAGQVSGPRARFVAGRHYIDAIYDYDATTGSHIKVTVGVARYGGTRVNRDGATDHWLTIVSRKVDEDHKLYYEYAEVATPDKVLGRFYVDPRTDMLYAPRNSQYTVGHEGYQVTAIRGFAGGNWGREFQRITGAEPNTLDVDPNMVAGASPIGARSTSGW